jgi:hypothetical protein
MHSRRLPGVSCWILRSCMTRGASYIYRCFAAQRTIQHAAVDSRPPDHHQLSERIEFTRPDSGPCMHD